MNVQFIPWLPYDKEAKKTLDINSRPQGDLDLDFTKHRDGISQATARDLEMKFRRLPSGASPGVLDWAELTSTLMGRLRVRSKKLLRKSLKKKLGKDQETKEKEKEEKEGKEEEEKRSRRYEEAKEVEERHHRLASGIIEGRHLSQICCLDNAETDTQASIWADFTNKQVRHLIFHIISSIKLFFCCQMSSNSEYQRTSKFLYLALLSLAYTISLRLNFFVFTPAICFFFPLYSLLFNFIFPSSKLILLTLFCFFQFFAAQVIVSFRGTEQVKFKDILTDINMMQVMVANLNCCIVLYFTVLYYAVLYYTVLYCTLLYCTLLHCALLY